MATLFFAENRPYTRLEIAAEPSLQGAKKAIYTMAMEDKSQQRYGTLRRFTLAFLAVALTGCMATSEGINNTSSDAPISKVQQQPLKDRQRIAAEMFRARCTKAGVFIHRTVEGVDGVFLMKLRPDKINYGDQYKLDDPYGSDSTGEGYIESFLRGSFEATHKYPDSFVPPLGYLYVEVVDPKDGVRYRYTGSVVEPWKNDKSYLKGYTKFILEKVPAKGPRPRYGVTYDDISTREERDYWIAGSSLKVIDLQTNEVIAERIGYMVDWAQGIGVGGRAPWLLAANNACPEFSSRHGSSAQPRQAANFVQKVAKPSEKK